MKTKKIICILSLAFLLTACIFAQEKEITDTPVGEWCDNYFTPSNFFLDINNYEIKYTQKKTDKSIMFSYKLVNTDEGNFITFSNYYEDSLQLNEIDKDLFYHLTNVSPDIRFTRKDNTMTFFLVNQKGKQKQLTLYTLESKQALIDAGKKLGKDFVEGAAGYAAYKAADYLSGKIEMKDIADECLAASKKY